MHQRPYLGPPARLRLAAAGRADLNAVDVERGGAGGVVDRRQVHPLAESSSPPPPQFYDAKTRARVCASLGERAGDSGLAGVTEDRREHVARPRGRGWDARERPRVGARPRP